MLSDASKTYNCKILPYGTLATIAIILSISFPLMYAGIFLGIPVLINVLLFVGSIYLLLNKFSAQATFVISNKNLQRTLHTTSFLFKNVLHEEFAWNQVKSFKSGTDKGKYRGEFQFLEIKFSNSSVWYISDMYGERKPDYDEFLSAFSEQVKQFNHDNKTPQQPSAASTASLPAENKRIEREKTFYETIWAKLFTIVLGVFIVIVFLFAGPYMSASSVFKMNFVLLPGFAYMFYRSFIKKEKPV